MTRRLRALVSFAQAAAVGSVSVSVLVLPAGPARAAAGARPAAGEIASLSCASAGACTAVGFRGAVPIRFRPLVVSEKNGVWGSVGTVGGSSALPGGVQGVRLGTVSCSSAGNCGAGGAYDQPAGFNLREQGLVVTERGGAWGKAMAVPDLAALNAGHDASVGLMSCRSAGSCTAAGRYTAGGDRAQVFVVSEKDGTWGQAEPIPGLALPGRSGAFASALSCGSPGDCTIGGDYATRTGTDAFAATQTDGTWSPVQTFPAIAAISKFASIDTLSCQPDGDCTGTGTYRAGGRQHVFAVSRTAGTWGAPALIPGSDALPGAAGDILSCPSPGNCTVSGGYFSKHGLRPFVATEKNGTWGQAGPLPGIAALNAGPQVHLNGLVCFPAGACTAAGDYLIQHKKHTVAAIFVTAEKNGTWGKPLRMPGSLVNLGTNIDLTALSCGAPGDCSAGGTYGPYAVLPFLVTQKNGTWGKARPARGIRH